MNGEDSAPNRLWDRTAAPRDQAELLVEILEQCRENLHSCTQYIARVQILASGQATDDQRYEWLNQARRQLVEAVGFEQRLGTVITQAQQGLRAPLLSPRSKRQDVRS